MKKESMGFNESAGKGLHRRDFLKLAGMGMVASTGLWLGLPNHAFGAEELAKSQYLRFGTISGDIMGVLDPMYSYWDMPELHFLYNGLIRMKVGDESIENLEPDIATGYTVSDDKTVYTFKLRKGVKFRKGYGECTAEDVLFSFDRLINNPNSALKSAYKDVDKLETPDDYTFRVQVKQPNYYFLRNFIALNSAYVVSKKAVTDLGDKFKTNPVGTGPFQFKEYRVKDRIVFVRHDEYFGGRPILEQIDFIFMPQQNVRLMALESRNVEMVRSIRSGDLVQRLKSKGLVMDECRGSMVLVFFNLYDPIFKNKLVREALFYATDRQALSDYFAECGGVLWGMVPPNLDGAKEYRDRYLYNPEKAKELLKKAGYPNGFTFSTIISEDPKRQHTMEILQSQWKKVNVNMGLNVMDHAAGVNRMRKGDVPVAWYGAVKLDIDLVVSDYFYSPACYKEPTAVANLSCYGHAIPGVDDLIEQARVTFDREQRNAIYAKIQDRLMEDIPGIPALDSAEFHARQPYVDLGYKFIRTFNYSYRITEKTRLLKH